MSNEKKTLWSSFEIVDRESCEKAIKNGVGAALFSGGLSACFAIAGFYTQSKNEKLNYLLDPWLMVDVVLILVLAFFISRKSRVASVIMVTYFLLSKLILWAEMGVQGSGLVISALFFLYYFTAMRGTFLWHSKYRESPKGQESAVSLIKAG